MDGIPARFIYLLGFWFDSISRHDDDDVKLYSIMSNKNLAEACKLLFLWVLPGAFSLLVAWGSLWALESQSFGFTKTTVLWIGVFMPLYYIVGAVIADKIAPRGKLVIPIFLLLIQVLLLMFD